jgi:hypothetical protein
MNPDTPEDVDVADYVSQLLPKFTRKQALTVAEQYQGLGTPLNQATLVYSEGQAF